MKTSTAGIVAVAIIGAALVGWMLLGNGQPDQTAQTDDATTTTNINDSTMESPGTMGEMESMEESPMAEAPQSNIVETAQAAGSFDTLLQAAQAAGLAEALATEEVTVFAPTDEAFAALPEGTLQQLLDNPDQLAQVLQYHVVPGRVMAADVVELDMAETLQGSSVDISTHDGSVMVDEATVVQTDIEASNGVIHVIDTVLTP